ncbi:MAG: hypothetical protein ACI9QD_000178 [Thermoproteota archaeon]|jgi:hypothetical protein
MLASLKRPIDFLKRRINKRMRIKKTVYIIPTREGFFFATGNLVLFIMALSYGNNALLFLAFLLFSFFIYQMFFSHFNLYGLEVHNIQISHSFTNSEFEVLMKIKNNSFIPTNRLDIELDLPESVTKTIFSIDNIEPRATKNYNAKFKHRRRDHVVGARIKLSSFFPYKLFYVWKFRKTIIDFYSYPEQIGKDLSYFKYTQPDLIENQDQFEFKEHCKYQNQNYKRINWKVFAKAYELVIKEYDSDQFINYHFNLGPLSELITDKELLYSQVSLWITQAYKLDNKWSLNSKDRTLELDSSEEHYQESMRLLSDL